MSQTFEKRGLVLTEKNGKIIRISSGDRIVSLGDTVISNGRYLAPDITGTVKEISIPGEDARTTDVIVVEFELRGGRTAMHNMKFKDLRF